MRRVSIFTTDEAAARFTDFIHGDTAFRFDLLEPGGPTRLVDNPAWAFVDWVMAELSGLEMCRRLRADPRLRDAHVTMVLEGDDSEDRRRSLQAGADDYAVGPLDRQAMLDRVLALYAADRQRTPTPTIFLGELQINVAGEQARWCGQLIPLRPNEFRVLRFMAENPNRVLSRRELVEALGKAGQPDCLRTVDVWIKRLRFGLRGVDAGHLLRTVHGKGYVLDLL
jgi:two-component system phosphate regulon response regulator PhoB